MCCIFNIDRKFQTFILNTFPQYGVGLTKFEDNTSVKQGLEKVKQKPMDETKISKPKFDIDIFTNFFHNNTIWQKQTTSPGSQKLTKKT